jgi:hypothetical protein
MADRKSNYERLLEAKIIDDATQYSKFLLLEIESLSDEETDALIKLRKKMGAAPDVQMRPNIAV